MSRRQGAIEMGHLMHLDITVPPEGQASAVIRAEKDTAGMISGVVLDAAGQAVPGAAVQLYEKGISPSEGPCSACFTDEEGCFLFGPVTPGGHYRLRIFTEQPVLPPAAPPARKTAEPDSPQAYAAFKDMYKQ